MAGRKTSGFVGRGSKAVAFLTTLGIREEVSYVVDINPHKYGTYLAGAGQQIVAPSFLETYRPDVVLIMNSVYRTEIGAMLQGMGLSPAVWAVDERLKMAQALV